MIPAIAKIWPSPPPHGYHDNAFEQTRLFLGHVDKSEFLVSL